MMRGQESIQELEFDVQRLSVFGGYLRNLCLNRTSQNRWLRENQALLPKNILSEEYQRQEGQFLLRR